MSRGSESLWDRMYCHGKCKDAIDRGCIEGLRAERNYLIRLKQALDASLTS